jgi:hypothetical protein
MAIRCAHCKASHDTVAEVRRCAGFEQPAAVATMTRPQAPGGTVCPFHGVELDAKGNCWEHEAERAMQERERQEDREVAEYKMRRDERFGGYPDAPTRVPAPQEPRQVSAKEFGKEVPAGRYAIQDARTGTITFYIVEKPTEGKWQGYTFVKMLVGSPGDWRKVRVTDWRGTLSAIKAFGTEAALRLFAEKARRCGLCNSPISTVRSRAGGIGPVCAEKNGYFYPSENQAREMLQERGIDPDDKGTWWNEEAMV